MPGSHDNFQSRATKIGTAFEKWCAVTLESIGFALQGKKKLKEAGIEIDQIAKNKTGQVIFFQFKGSSKPPRQGLRRSDTVKKALCDAFLLDKLGYGPYIIVTSHKPEKGSSMAVWLQLAKDVVFDVICIHDEEDFERLQSYAETLPWRSRSAAKLQTKPVQTGADFQPSLLNIETLEPFTKGARKRPQKGSKKKASA